MSVDAQAEGRREMSDRELTELQGTGKVVLSSPMFDGIWLTTVLNGLDTLGIAVADVRLYATAYDRICVAVKP